VTAPVPAPRLSPIAGFANALRRLAIRGLTAVVAERTTELAAKRELNDTLRTTASYEANLAAGYIDRTGLETS
jgi:hypothetical protein